MSWIGRLFAIMRSRDRIGAERLVTAGVRLARDGQTEAALQFYEKAARADRGYALAHLNAALARQDLYNRDRADLSEDARKARLHDIIAALDIAVELEASLAQAYSARAYVFRALQRDEEAQLDFEHFLEIADDEDKFRAEVERDLNALKQKIDARQLRIKMLEAAGNEDLAVEDLQEARDYLQQAVELQPDDVELWWALGVCLRRSGDLTAAELAFLRCVDLDAGRVAAFRELSSLAFKAAHFAEALDFAEQAYRLNPTDAATVCNLGVCHLEMGEKEKAREFIELSHELDEDDPIVQNCLQALNNGDAA